MAASARSSPLLEPAPPGGGGPALLRLRLTGPVRPGDARSFSARIGRAVEAAGGPAGGVRMTIECDVARLGPGDLAAIDALARVALAARRGGCPLLLRGASPHLRELIELAGLRRALPCPAAAQASSRGGSPKSGKKRAVSRKKVIPAMRSPSSSTTWSDHGS